MTLLKKAILVGLGATEQAKEMIDDLSKKGELNQSGGAQRMKSMLDLGERVERECSQKMGDVLKRVAESVRIPSMADIERLEKGLASLSDQVKGMGRNSNGEGDPSSTVK